MKITVDRTKCSAIGLCEMTAPDVFQVDDDGKLHIADISAMTDAVRDAVDSCPTAALSIEQ
ncbi:ferredoxin [Mycolicibacterium sp. XJ1819]